LDSGNLDSYPGTGTQWNDLSENNIVGTFSGDVVYSSDFGGVIRTNPGGKVSLSTLQSFGENDPHTYFAFIRLSQISDTYNFILYNGGNQTGTSLILQRNGWTGNQGGVGLFYRGLDSFASIYHGEPAPFSGVPNVNLNEWCCVGLTYDGNFNVNFYFNGQFIKTVNLFDRPFIPNFAAGNNGPTVGSINTGGSQFVGDLPVIGVYSKQLTNSEMLENYNALKNRYI